MHIGFHSFYGVYNQNKMFLDESSPIGDDLSYPFVFFKKHFESLGHSVNTIDMAPLESFDRIIFLDYPTRFNSCYRKLLSSNYQELYLVLFEPPELRPDNYERKNHRHFKKVFTWHDDWVDNVKYFKFFFPVKLRLPPAKDLQKSKFCNLIASQKYTGDSSDLYSERVRAIEWFQRHHPEEFDLFGIGWDRHYWNGAYAKYINFALSKAYKTLPKLPKSSRFSGYRGPVQSKHNCLRQYKFSICYENLAVPGFITEKILDCFFANTVPVYLGAPNVMNYIPSSTFINKHDFASYADLYRYLKDLPAKDYRSYLDSIHDFLGGPQSKLFGAEHFANLIGAKLGIVNATP